MHKQSEQKVLELESKIRSKNGCNLIVGTGINNKLTPSWTDLISKIFQYILKSKLYYLDEDEITKLVQLFKDEDVYFQAHIIKEYLGKREYMMLIRDEIYFQQSDYAEKINDSLIPVIAEFCKKKYVKSIISINYDDYLEMYLRQNFIKFVSVYSAKSIKEIKKDTIPIYHVHGFIDRQMAFSELFQQDITFSLDEYFNLFNHPFIWQNTVPIFQFMLYPSIFLGTSLRDINLNRIIKISNSNANNNGSDAYWFKEFKEQENIHAMEFIAHLKGINYINCGEPKVGNNPYLMINEVLRKLIQSLPKI